MKSRARTQARHFNVEYRSPKQRLNYCINYLPLTDLFLENLITYLKTEQQRERESRRVTKSAGHSLNRCGIWIWAK